jgi:hypothetical protein
MSSRTTITGFLVISGLIWLVAMSFVYRAHYTGNAEPELGYFAADVRFDDETTQYYAIRRNGQRIAYTNASVLDHPTLFLLRESTAIKINLAGMSREVFLQTTVRVDTTSHLATYLEFNLQSGEHSYVCSCSSRDDTLFVDVMRDTNSEWALGVFEIKGELTFPTALVNYLHHTTGDESRITLFDPVLFDHYELTATREGRERLFQDGVPYDTTRFRLNFLDRETMMWIDDTGVMAKSEGYAFFGGEFGSVEMDRAMNSDVFLLPLEVSVGNDILKNLRIKPDRDLPNPRESRYLEVRLDNIRAANIDINSSFKKTISVNPVIFGMYDRPVVKSDTNHLKLITAAQDTAVIGTSDYIQSLDARMKRRADEIAADIPDTLDVARAINQWVFESMTREKGLDLTRSVDVLRNMRGDHEEYTKLYTSLTRSIGIPTQIIQGLVYEDGVFRYHSWPAVFAHGIWHHLDPLFGQDAVDATHIPLIEGNFDRLIEMIRIAERIGVTIREYR